MLKDWLLKPYSNRPFEGRQTNTQTHTAFYIGRLFCMQPMAAGCIIAGSTTVPLMQCPLFPVSWYSFCRPRKDDRLSQPTWCYITAGQNGSVLAFPASFSSLWWGKLRSSFLCGIPVRNSSAVIWCSQKSSFWNQDFWKCIITTLTIIVNWFKGKLSC